MFFIAGIKNGVRECGGVEGTCPACGSAVTLHVCNQYMTPHVFFIPTFRFGCRYLATCPACASVMELERETGRAVEKGQTRHVSPEALAIVQDNARGRCPRCGARGMPGGSFCSHCGGRL